MKGFVSPLVVVLFLVFGLAIMVVASQEQTGLLNMARSDYASFKGTVVKVSPCASFQLCYKLDQASGPDYYLRSRKDFNFFRPQSRDRFDLSKFVGKEVIVRGLLIDRVDPQYILVSSVILVSGKDPLPANSCRTNEDCDSGKMCQRVQCIQAPCYGVCVGVGTSPSPKGTPTVFERWDRLRY